MIPPNSDSPKPEMHSSVTLFCKHQSHYQTVSFERRVYVSTVPLLIYLSLAVLGLHHCTGFSLVVASGGLLSSCGAQASRCFTYCGAQALGAKCGT